MFAFRGQTDSSCSGEVISSIFTHDASAPLPLTDYPVRDDWSEAALAIERYAVEVDAEPGLTSGLHVHVGIGHLLPTQLHNAFHAFLRWELVIQNLAQGRFPHLRGENRAVRDDMDTYELYDWLVAVLRRQRDTAPPYIANLRDALSIIEAEENADLLPLFREQMYAVHRGHDRHSALNIRSRRPTWEFRLWNSTRSAWRIELFTRLSVALVDPAVVDALLTAPPGRGGRITQAQVNRLIEAVDGAGHHDCAALMERQRDYNFQSDEIPSSFSLV